MISINFLFPEHLDLSVRDARLPSDISLYAGGGALEREDLVNESVEICPHNITVAIGQQDGIRRNCWKLVDQTADAFFAPT